MTFGTQLAYTLPNDIRRRALYLPFMEIFTFDRNQRYALPVVRFLKKLFCLENAYQISNKTVIYACLGFVVCFWYALVKTNVPLSSKIKQTKRLVVPSVGEGTSCIACDVQCPAWYSVYFLLAFCKLKCLVYFNEQLPLTLCYTPAWRKSLLRFENNIIRVSFTEIRGLDLSYIMTVNLSSIWNFSQIDTQMLEGMMSRDVLQRQGSLVCYLIAMLAMLSFSRCHRTAKCSQSLLNSVLLYPCWYGICFRHSFIINKRSLKIETYRVVY